MVKYDQATYLVDIGVSWQPLQGFILTTITYIFVCIPFVLLISMHCWITPNPLWGRYMEFPHFQLKKLRFREVCQLASNPKLIVLWNQYLKQYLSYSQICSCSSIPGCCLKIFSSLSFLLKLCLPKSVWQQKWFLEPQGQVQNPRHIDYPSTNSSQEK